MHTKAIITLFFLLATTNLIPGSVSAHEDHKQIRERAVERFREARQERPVRNSLFEHQQEVLLRAIDLLVKHAELLLERVENFSIIQEDKKTNLQEEIQDDITKLEEFKTQVTETTTKEQLRELAQELKDHRANVAQKKVRKLMLLAHIGVYQNHILEVTSARADRIAEKLNEFEELGIEISVLETLLKEAKNTIASASNDLRIVEEDILIKNTDDTTMTETRNALKSIKDRIKSVYGLFRTIAKEAKEL